MTREITIPEVVWHRRGIDWGSSVEHPFVCLWGCKDSSGHWYVYDEYWNNSQKLLPEDHLQTILRRRPWPDASIYHGMTYADPSRPDLMRVFGLKIYCPVCFERVHTTGKDRFDPVSCPECTWNGHRGQLTGLTLAPARNAVYEGIECVRKHLKVDSTGMPMLTIDRNRCPHLAREMSTYRWKQSSGKGVNPQAAKPEPLKKNDDAVDALRYLIYSDAKSEAANNVSGLNVKREVPKSVRFQRR